MPPACAAGRTRRSQSGILRELRAQFALDGGRVEQLTECKLDGRFRPANVRRRYVTADLNRPVVVHLRAA